MSNVFPEASLHLPLRESQEATLDLANPFTDGQVMRHPNLRKSSFMPEGEAVNGYIKFRLRAADLEGDNETTNHYFNQLKLGVHHREPVLGPLEKVPKLPPDFGKGLKLDKMDSKLLTFCKNASSFSVSSISVL